MNYVDAVSAFYNGLRLGIGAVLVVAVVVIVIATLRRDVGQGDKFSTA